MSQYRTRRLTALCVAAVATAGAVAATGTAAAAAPATKPAATPAAAPQNRLAGMVGTPVPGTPFHAGPAARPKLRAAAAAPTDAGHFVATQPTRFYDTRTKGGPIRGGSILPLDFPPGTIDARVTAITFNMTVTNVTQDTAVTMWDAQGPLPDAAQVVARKGETRANQVTVPVVRDSSNTAHIYIHNRYGAADVVLDTEGAYGNGTPDQGQIYNGYLPQATTTRVYDTKATGGGGPYGAGVTRTIDLSKSVPKDATAVTVNLTAASHAAGGYLTLYPAGTRRGEVSSINVQAGETTANQVTVPLSAAKTLSLYNSAGSNDVTLDLEGAFVPDATNPTAGLYYSTGVPVRTLDTRNGTGIPAGPLDPQETVAVPVGGTDDQKPRIIATTAVLTANASNAATFLTAWPSATADRPNVSTLTLTKLMTASNAIATGVNNDTISLYNNAGQTPAALDVSGYYLTTPPATR